MKNIVLVSVSNQTPANIAKIVNKKIYLKKLRGFPRLQKAVNNEQNYDTGHFSAIKKAIETKKIDNLVLYRDCVCYTQIALRQLAVKNGIEIIELN